MSESKISVIVPCYNVAPYIARCLDSLINQTLSEIEIICIDDKSSDDTLSIIKQYAKTDRRIRIIALDKNSGVSVARNMGLDIARGEYIGFVDPDDYIDSDFYYKLYQNAKQNNADISKGNVYHTQYDTGHTHIDNAHKLIRRHIAYFCNTFWSAIYRHSVLQENNIRFPCNSYSAEDIVFLLQVTLTTRNICICDDTFYHYVYQRPGSLDPAFLSHIKAESKIRSIRLNLDMIERADLTKSDFRLFMRCFILGSIKYEFTKTFEQESDRQQIFNILVLIYNLYKDKRDIKRVFGRRTLRYIKNNNYEKFINIYISNHQRLYLFGVFPFVRIDYTGTDICLTLFDLLPVLRINRKRKVYLFNYVFIFKLRG